MIQALSTRFQKRIAGILLLIFYCEGALATGMYASVQNDSFISYPGYQKSSVSNFIFKKRNPLFVLSGAGNLLKNSNDSLLACKSERVDEAKKNEVADFSGGPSQPEMQAFQSVNNTNMVDLFSGDFSYNIPLMDVGGYPLNIAYRSGISMDQEASWVGLGWNINPGTITRNMRGLPDDFNGIADTVKKTSHIKENKTIGVTGGADMEITGLPIPANIGGSLGIFHNNYKGWGLETGLNASINAGAKAEGPFSGGLSLTNNSQEGLSITPSLSININQHENEEKSGVGGSLSIAAPYNSRTGLKSLQLSTGIRQFSTDSKNQVRSGSSAGPSGVISFATPSFTPTITLPYTSNQFTFTAKVGTEIKVTHPSFFISGYVSKQRIDDQDTTLTLPSYGYLNYQEATGNPAALLDFNREKEIPYREKPPVPHIAIPSYTYDVFSITGEGTGGMFRAYRGDIGFVYDHAIQTKDESARASVDIGLGDIFHGGIDLNLNRAYTQNGPWLNENLTRNSIAFKPSRGAFEAAYFRNPGEMAVNSKDFYKSIGDDDVVAVNLYQAGTGSSVISATNLLNRYQSKRLIGQLPLSAATAVKTRRDKRTQVISYLTAQEASTAGSAKYIENYSLDSFSVQNCHNAIGDNVTGRGSGLMGMYYNGTGGFKYLIGQHIDTAVNFYSQHGPFLNVPGGLTEDYSVRWTGRIKAPVTGNYTIATRHDDGSRVWINDSLLIDNWHSQAVTLNTASVNLVAGDFYDIKIEYVHHWGIADLNLMWAYTGQILHAVPQAYLYPLAADAYMINAGLTMEKRVNTYRKANHISEIDVLNADGRRYAYGIPVYNFKQKEASFSVNSQNGNKATGLVKYSNGIDNTTHNQNGKDNYFSSEEIPAYAHSFLLTGIYSPDYVDLTGDGISDDDLGDAIHFKYTKLCGPANPYKWKAPYVSDSATYNEGLKTDNRDDKGSYVYGEKELWYLNSVESKNMIATFTVENRLDLGAMDEAGNKTADQYAKRLKQIDLYSKADFIKNGRNARPVKTVHFEYSYELCAGVNKPLNDSGKLTLRKIWFTYNGNDKGKLNPYVFTYHANNPSFNINAYDKWGNYKNPLQNPGSSAGNIITNADYPYSLQDSASAAYNSAAWTLTQVKLPSGGTIKVDYESDDYAFVQNKRAGQMFKLAGFASSSNPGVLSPNFYNSDADNLYVFVTVSDTLNNKSDVYNKYLEGITKLFFKLAVKMPTDKYGGGYEYIPCYAGIDTYGFVPNTNRIWIKIKGISLAGDTDGSYSPLAKAAIQYLRLNLGSKAYPNSEVGDNIDLNDAVNIVFSLAGNIVNAFKSFDKTARAQLWGNTIDLNRTLVRLDNPTFKKLGGGLRVKRIVTYDNWNAMTGGKKESVYGKQYDYTTVKQINGASVRISSGVASYEPMIGGDENPFHIPVEYTESIAPLAPVTMGYTEEPLGESFFPSAEVGYSKVTVRSINTANRRSANGYEETKFYTAYDFPTLTDRSLLDGDTKKRYKPALANFLRINARYYLTMSQGFKVELNDMHGKMRSQATYPETDPNNPISYTENFYRVDDQSAEFKHLSSNVMAMDPSGNIDTASLIGKDIELMTDMREQESVTNGNNINVNADFFSIPFLPPFMLIPSLFNLAQREENRFRSVAVTKVIQRHGIEDSVVHIEKGSKVSTKNLLFDSETGDVLLSRMQNEFNDPLYNFTYPSHWAYDGMGEAYKNIDVVFDHLFIKGGKITAGLAMADTTWFTGGDELLISSKPRTGPGTDSCHDAFASFKDYSMIWAIDTAMTNGGAKSIYFIDKNGVPFTGNDVSLKITRSGRRNINTSVGSIATLVNPLVKNTVSNTYSLVLNTSSKVINTTATEFKQIWKGTATANTCTPVCPSGGVLSGDRSTCLLVQPVFNNVINDSTCLGTKYYQGVYGAEGTVIYSSTDTATATKTEMDWNNVFWRDSSTVFQGPLNRCGMWTCTSQHPDSTDAQQTSLPSGVWTGFSTIKNMPYTGTYYIGMAGDNGVRIFIDGNLIKENHTGDFSQYTIWPIYAVNLSQGNHLIKAEGINDLGPGLFGVEIYGNTLSEIISAQSYNDLNMVFSTAEGWGNSRPLPRSATPQYSCPSGYSLDTAGGVYTCSQSVSPIITVNSHAAGMLGNWRAYKAYTYYGIRAESNPTLATNIRQNGAYKDFTPFWAFSGNSLQPQYDSSRWVWNSEITLFNGKGFELENKDPLGRYNGGLYGYNNSLPVAVVQNGRYSETVFDGLEDYDFSAAVCDTGCSVTRQFNFSAFKNKISTAEKHSGKYSLKLNAGEVVTVSTFVRPYTDNSHQVFTYTSKADTCSGQTLLQTIRTDSNSVLPQFTPIAGKKVVIGAWVKEGRNCKCTGYTGNQISIGITENNSTSFTNFIAAGSIIEGWQRYEAIIDVPAGASALSVSFKATDTAAVYFDDIRIHPFIANMKSFVYDPVNLRLMAELDENNYASFYEYDDDGTLIRVKKETERGIKTIKETRSALLKQ